MRESRSLVELAKEIERQTASKKDLVVASQNLELQTDLTMRIKSNGNEAYGVKDLAHDQIAERLSIPKKYYDKMRSQSPGLLAMNVNHWLQDTDDRRMIRLLDGNVRAVLSDRYHPIDNITVLAPAIESLSKLGEIKVMTSELTETRMYLQVVSPKIQGEVRVGDFIQAGMTISNSEVGLGAFRIEPMLFRLACLNGAIRSISLRKYHVGRRTEIENDMSIQYLSNETVLADTRALQLKLRDMITYAFREDLFFNDIEKLKVIAENKVEAREIPKLIEDVTDKYSLSQTEGEGILTRLIESSDLTQYGIVQAVTNLANDANQSWDRTIELQRIGGQIVDLAPNEWRRMSIH